MSAPERSQVFLNAESFAYSFIYLYIHFNGNLNIHALISCEGKAVLPTIISNQPFAVACFFFPFFPTSNMARACEGEETG